ncbi:MAG: aldo/keto reductase, partial [Bacteroidales bacterium]|nr:aldo/keto reductase [Bacteroidales bacterium]
MKTENKINRRRFLQIFGAGTAATAAMLTGCSDAKKDAAKTENNDIPTDKMTYRTDSHGQQVSILGYGCMRFPTIQGKSGREDSENAIDQEEVNRLIDYAIAHGVNLFDTS